MNPKTRILSRAAFAALVAALSPVFSLRATPPPVAPLVANAGFEATPALTGWTTVGAATVSLTADHHTGSSAAKVQVSTALNDGIKQSLLGQMSLGRSYLVSAWVRLATGSAAARIGLHISATANGIVNPSAGLVEQPIADAGGIWHYVSGAVELDTNAAPATLDLFITSDNVAATFEVDDVAVYPLSATGIHNAHFASQVGSIGAGAVRQIMNLYTLEDNLAALTNPGSWSIITDVSPNKVLKQASPYFSTICNLSPGIAPSAGTWTDYIFSVDVRIDTTTPSGLETASLRFALDGVGDGYLLTVSPTKLVLSKFFTTGSQILATATDSITVGTFHTYAITFDATHGSISVARDGGSPAITASDSSMTSGSVGLGTFRCQASFDNLTLTTIGSSSPFFSDDFQGAMQWTGSNSMPFAQLTSVGGGSVPVVFTFSPTDLKDPATNATVVPSATTTTTASTVQSELASFLTLYGQYISIFAVANEPNIEYSSADRTLSGGTSPLLDWLKAVAQNAQSTIASNPSTLSGLTVATGSMDAISLMKAYSNTGGYRTGVDGEFLQAMCNWANTDSNINFIDFHAHESSELVVEQALAYLQGQTTKPLISTEWSEAPAVNTWIAQHMSADSDPSFLSSSSLPASVKAGIVTNRQYVTATYANPVPLCEWNNFIAMSPLAADPNFLQNVTDLYNRNGVVVETYGGYDQYGAANFDMKQLYANLTVRLSSANAYQPNATYLSQFTNLSPTLPVPVDQVFFDDFYSEAGTGLNSNWATSGGTWTVPTGSDPNLQQTATSGTGCAIVNTSAASVLDSRVAAEITATGFSTSVNAVGVVARYSTDPTSHLPSYYSGVYRDGGHTLAVQKCSAGSTTTVHAISFTLATGQAHRFELQVQGGTLKLYVDYVLEIQTSDPGAPLAAGQPGLIANNATASFDNIDVRRGLYAENFTSSGSNWSVVGGTWAYGSGTYRQTSTSGLATAYLSALSSLAWTSNYAVEAQVTPNTMTGSPSTIGVVARYTSSGASATYYALLYQSDIQHVVLQKVNGSGTSNLKDLPIDLSAAPKFELKLEARGNRLRGYLNGRMICSEQDSDLTAGSAGLMTNNAAGTFAYAVVTQLNPP